MIQNLSNILSSNISETVVPSQALAMSMDIPVKSSADGLENFAKLLSKTFKKSRLLMQWKKPIVFARKLKNFGRKTIS